MTFNDLVRDRIQELGITITEASRRCGMFPAHLNQIYNGKVLDPRLEVSLRILKGLELPIESLRSVLSAIVPTEPKHTRPTIY